MRRSLIILTATAIIGQGTSKDEIEALQLAADRLGDDPVDRRVQGLPGLISAERAQALNQDGIEPHRDPSPPWV